MLALANVPGRNTFLGSTLSIFLFPLPKRAPSSFFPLTFFMQSLPRKPLPARPAFLVMLGPGIIWMALAQGSGELIWWPYIVAKYGLAFLFLLIPACIIQFPLTFEIGRYTILTGEGIFRGFFRLNKWYGGALWLLFTVSFLWFGAFATAGGTAIARLTNFPTDWQPRSQTLFWAQVSIIFFTVAILYAKTAYRLIEWVMKIVASISIVGMAVACSHPSVRSHLGEFLKGLIWPDFNEMQKFQAADAEQLLTAITFAWLGGFWTLFYSYWIKEKGAGMASYMVPMTGFRGHRVSLHGGAGTLPAQDAESTSRLKSWYRYLALETWIGILGNLATTLMTCLLAFVLLHPEKQLPEQFEIAVVQSQFFAVSWGDAGRLLFLFIAGAFLADTWLATVDCVSRIHLDALESIWPEFSKQDQRTWYYGIVLALAGVTSVTMYLEPPGTLILLSAVIGIFGTVSYSLGLIFLNHVVLRRQLAPAQKSSRWSMALLIFVALCYLALAIGYLIVKFIHF